ncbi:type III PLP-dependent enzyme [Streptomyces sp. NBC_00525]|uniref:type III PLP-dependent enzyme n=1 Tax=Streptomyces sp. NBC_00525 TaxID=2903660 RepID=UPI002E80FFDB|nr:type III PLP-dependent enzyme [Streptomyces sp. NBC_00525]WUC94189.1 type III PLP-dependent enzyme [Streptomyces sp. NBC_00525]
MTGEPGLPPVGEGQAGEDRIVFDLDGVRERYETLRREVPGVDVRFAMKACPVDEVLDCLIGLGAGIDAASMPELEHALRAGAVLSRTHYGNTVKSDQDIAAAYRLGVRDFATDSQEDVSALVRHAPGARVYCRLATTGEGALWGLKHKFGCSPDDAVRILTAAEAGGLAPSGLSVHVGSQQMNPDAWLAAFERLDAVLAALAARGIVLDHVNLGGGLPALDYLDRHGNPLRPPIDKIFLVLREGMAALRRAHGEHLGIVMEPGRYLVADHGTIHTHVVRMTARCLPDGVRQRWLYLGVGKFNGLYEMDMLQYRLVFPSHTAGRTVSAVVAGPTCDSDDAYSPAHGLVEVPEDLASGDPVQIVSCGAYAVSYMTQGFNGFAPLPRVCTGGTR